MTMSVRLKTAFLHLAASVVLALLIGMVVLGVWFPGDYAKVARGWQLLLLILCVDSVCGPLLTGILFNPRKSRRELTLDMSLVVLIQLAALGYGVHAALQARPVVVAFEGDRFRVVTAAEVDPARLSDAPAEFQTLSLHGPVVIGARIPRPNDPDFDEVMSLGLAGLDVSFQPRYWQSFDSLRANALRAARPLSMLRAKYPGESHRIDKAVATLGLSEHALKYLPVQTRRLEDDWLALVRENDAAIIGFLPLDGF